MSDGSILIVGAGIGGLATAIALSEADFDVSVVELQPDIHSSIFGVGIIQAPNQLRALDLIGCAEPCLEQGYQAQHLTRQFDQAGNLEKVIPGPRIQGLEFPPMNGITRPRLHNILTERALSVGASVEYGKTFTEIKQYDDRVEAVLNDGSTRTADLIIGADGVRSAVRRYVLGAEWQPQYSGKSAFRINIPRLSEMDAIVRQDGIAPDGEAIGVGFVPLAPDLGYMYINVRWDRSLRLSQQELREIAKDKLSLFGGPAAEIRDGYIDTDEEIVLRPEEWLLAPAPWHKDRVVLIGDAVHSVTPNTAQGAAQAIEDGIVLAESLRVHETLEQALTAYVDRRYERCRLVVEYGYRARQAEFNRTPGFDREREGLRMRESLMAPF